MSDRVDKRIVEMQFDNAQFKTGVAETLNLLKNLDKALLFQNGQKGFGDIQASANKVDFSSMVNGIDQVEGSLGGLKGTAATVIDTIGGIAGSITKIGGIASAVLGAGVIGTSISKGLSRAQNLAQAKFTMEGLDVAWESILPNINAAVDGTAYGLDEAAVAASSLVASGVAVGDQMETTLKSIAGVAAMTGRSYSDIGNIFTTVAGQGKLMTMQLRQLEMSGMNAAAHMAKYFGTTEAEIRDMVTNGEVSFEMFAEAMATFSDQAAKANQTFSGASANIGSALGRTTADFFEQVMGTKGLVPLLNDVRVFINGLNTATTSLMHSWTEEITDADGNITKITHWGSVISGVNSVLQELDKGFKEVLQMDEKEKATGTFFTKWKETLDQLAPSVDRFFAFFANGAAEFVRFVANVISIIRAVAHVIISILDPISNAFDKIFGFGLRDLFSAFADGAGAIADFIDKLALTEPMAMIVQGAFTALFSAAKLLVDIIGGALSLAFRVLMGVLNLVVDAVHAVFDVFGAINDVAGGAIGGVLDFFSSIGGPVGEFFSSIIEDLKAFTEGVSSGIPILDALTVFFKGLDLGVVKIFEGLNGAFDWIGNIKTFLIDALKMAIGGLAIALGALFEIVAPIGEAIGVGLMGALENLRAFVETSGIIEFFSGIGQGISDIFSPDKAFGDGGESIDRANSSLRSFIQTLGDFAIAIRDSAVSFVGSAFEGLGKVVTGLWSVIGPALNSIKENAIKAFDIIKNAWVNSGITFEPIANMFSAIGETIGEFLGKFQDGLPTFEEVVEFLGTIKDKFLEMIGEVGPEFSQFMSQIGGDLSAQLDGPLGTLIGFINGVGETLGNFPSMLENIPDALGNFFGQFADLIDNPFKSDKTKASSSLKEGMSEIADTGFSIVDQLTSIKNALTKPWDTLYTFVHDGIAGGLVGIGDAINEALLMVDQKNINSFIQQISGIALSAGSLWGLFAVDKLMSNAAMLVGNMANIAYSADLLLKGITSTIRNIGLAISKDLKANAFAKRMIALAIAVLAIAGAIMMLSSIKEEDLYPALAAIAAVVGIIALFAVLMAALDKWTGGGAERSGIAMLAMAASVLLMAEAIKKIADIKDADLKKGAQAITQMMFLIAAMTLLAGFGGAGIGTAATIIALVSSLIIMALMIQVFATMPWQTYISGLILCAGVMFVLAGVVKYLNGVRGELIKGAGSMAILSTCLIAFAAAVGILTLIYSLNPVGMFVSVFLLIAAVASMATLIIALADRTKTASFAMKQIGTLFSDLGKALIEIAAAIAILSVVMAMNPVAGAGALGVLILTMVALVAAIEIIAKAGPVAVQAGHTITALAVGLAILSAAMFVLALLPTDRIMAVALGLSIVALSLAALSAVVGKFGIESAAGVVGIVALTVCLAGLAALMVWLGQEGVMEAAARGFLVFLGVLVVFTAVAIVVAALAPVFETFGLVLLTVAAALALIAAAALMFVMALQIMHDMGVEAVLSTAEELAANTDRIQSAAEGIGRALVYGIIGGITGIVGALGECLFAALSGAMSMATSALSSPVNEGVSTINMELQDAVNNQDWAQTYNPAGKGAAEGQAQGLKENQDQVTQASEEVSKTSGEAGGQAYTEAFGEAVDGEQAMSSFTEQLQSLGINPEDIGLDTDVLTGSFTDMFSSLGSTAGEGVLSGAQSSPVDLNSLMSNLNLSPSQTQDVSQESGEAIGTGVLEGITSSLSNDDGGSVSSALDTTKANMEAKSDEFRVSGEKTGQAYGEGIGTGVSNSTDIAKNAASNVAQNLTAGEGTARESGRKVGHGFGSSMINAMQTFASSARSAAQSMVSSAGSVNSNGPGYSVGADFAYGMAAGISAKSYLVTAAARMAASSAKEAAERMLDINSPSKEMIKVGKSFSEGFGIGITKYTYLATDAAGEMAETTISPVEKSMRLMSNLFDMVDWDSDPVIRPVLDLDDFETGIGRMNAMTAGASVRAAGWADRIVSTGPVEVSGSGIQNGGNQITVVLDYKAGATPNQIVQQIARELESVNMLGG